MPLHANMEWKDRVVVVTGGARGIGFAVVQLAYDLGASPVICDVDHSAVADAVAALKTEGKDALGIVGDVSSRDQVTENAHQVMATFGRIDVLVNNAGTQTTSPAVALSEQHWRRELDVCLTGAFFWSQAAATCSMIPRREGAIVNISSGAGLAAMPNSASYVAAKHGLLGLTKALAVDWAQHDIRVNCVCPGFTWTDLAKAITEANPEMMQQRVERIPLGNGAQPADVAQAILFLASSQRAGAVSGVALPVDGGTSALSSGYSAPDDEKGSC